MNITRLRFQVRVLAAAAMTVAALGACGGSSNSPSAASAVDPTTPATSSSLPPPAPSTTTPEPPTSARWDALMGTIGDDGEVSVQLAIDAFSLGVAPLPGTDTRKADSDAMVPDATSAVAWVIRHFDELSPEQQAAVGVALSPPEATQTSAFAGASGFRSTSAASPVAEAGRASRIGCYGQVVPTADSPDAGEYRAILDDVTGQITARLGGKIELVAPVYLILDNRDLGVGLAYTWSDPGDCNNNGLATCTIHLSPEAEGSKGAELRSILAHEVMHCFQFQYLGIGANELPPWILEGVPAWVGEDIAGGSKMSTGWWTRYLTAPERSLYARDYDAIGFYAHLDEVGIDPWSRFIQIFDGFSNEPAFEGAGASSGAFLDSWPSSSFRRADIGRAWDADGPGITIDRAVATPLSVGNGGVVNAEVGKVSGRLFQVALSADIVTIEFDGWARLGTEDGTDQVLSSGTSYCARANGCVCPDGSISPFDQIAANVVIGLTGGTDAAAITITGDELDCERPDPVEVVDACLVGQWVSTSSYIDDTVTGAPVDELGGGAGIVLTVASDGSFVMDFDASTPTSTDLGDGLVIASRTRGVAHGRITATNGQVALLEQDYTSSLTTQMNTGGSLAGGIGIGNGSYSCSSGSMEMRTPFDLGESINAFTKA